MVSEVEPRGPGRPPSGFELVFGPALDTRGRCFAPAGRQQVPDRRCAPPMNQAEGSFPKISPAITGDCAFLSSPSRTRRILLLISPRSGRSGTAGRRGERRSEAANGAPIPIPGGFSRAVHRDTWRQPAQVGGFVAGCVSNHLIRWIK